MMVDRTDARIIALLQETTRLTNEEIGQRVHLSSSAVAKRRKRLDQTGLIAAEVAALNLDKIGPFVSAQIHCAFQADGPATIDTFTAAMREQPEVTSCWVVAGDIDVILQVMTRTVSEYERLLRELQDRFPQLRSTRSYVILRHIKRSLVVPFPLADPLPSPVSPKLSSDESQP